MGHPTRRVDKQADGHHTPVLHQRKEMRRVNRNRDDVTGGQFDIEIARFLFALDRENAIAGSDGPYLILRVNVNLLKFLQQLVQVGRFR
jgi:hypothetical protein